MTRTSMVAAVAALVAAALTMVVAAAAGPEKELALYRVTLINLTAGQPFSPPVAATHDKSMRMFRVGKLASDELAAIAQDGNEGPMFALFDASPKTTDAVDVATPLTPHGEIVGSFTDTVSFEIEGRTGDRLSLATMLICTNDGFLGLDSVKLPKRGAEAYLMNGYDAGREENTEDSLDLVDPCSALGPAALPGDPDGNRDAEVATDPAERIAHHPNLTGGGELSPADHGWDDPVAVAIVARID